MKKLAASITHMPKYSSMGPFEFIREQLHSHAARMNGAEHFGRNALSNARRKVLREDLRAWLDFARKTGKLTYLSGTLDEERLATHLKRIKG